MRLRLATHDDLPALCALGREMHAKSSYASMDFDVDVVKATLGGLIDKSQFVVLAEDKNGDVIGGMAGQVTPSWFGKDMVASDLALFVLEDRRGGLAACRLVQAFVQWARIAGAKQIRPGVTTGSDAAVTMYERMGFMRVGASFMLEA